MTALSSIQRTLEKKHHILPDVNTRQAQKRKLKEHLLHLPLPTLTTTTVQ